LDAAKWYRKAIDSYRKAADTGDASAATALGNMYARGQGVTGDYSEAAGWWRKAADTGYPGAQYNLGMAYMRGRGVQEDRVQAYMWLSLAAASGTGEAKERRTKSRDAVAAELSGDQLAEAKRLVQEWKPKTKTPSAEAK
jgi:TPR repeat protein